MARPLITLIGATGAGKTVQAVALAAKLGYVHISTGELLRTEGNPLIIRSLNRGELAPDEYIDEILRRHLASLTNIKGVVLDGYPRTKAEAEWLEDQLPGLDLQLVKVIYLRVSRDESIARLLQRGRADDSRVSLEEKWNYFDKEVRPVIKNYRQQGLLAEIDGEGSAQAVTERINAVV